MTDHLAEARVDLDHLEACNHGSRLAHAIARILDHLEARQPDPEPDPLGETNHADRIDCVGGRWVWCDECDGFLMDHAVHKSGIGRSAVWIDERYGPVTFAPRPAEPPTTAPQPDEAHGDADEPDGPKLNVQIGLETSDVRRYATRDGKSMSPADFDRWLDGICHEAWGEGYRAGRTDEQDACHCEAWSDNECGCGRYGASATPNPYRKDRA